MNDRLNINSNVGFIESSVAVDLIKQASDRTTVILDFDETLFLRNSTAEYLDSLRPRWLGFVVLKMISLIQPWSWLPKPFRGSKIRDWFLVFGATLLLPWTFFLWQKKAKILADDYANLELTNAIANNPNSSIIVASLGFSFIINPVLNSFNIKYDRAIACRFWQGAKDRGKGKLLMVEEVLPEAAIKSSILVTDSYDDLPLLEVVDKPCLTMWSLAKYNPPLQDIRDFLVGSVKRFSHKLKRSL